MSWEPIVKSPGNAKVIPNLRNYEQARTTFSWEAARRELDGLPGGRGLNIAHEAIDRHAAGARTNHVAIRWISRTGATEDFTFGRLRNLTNRFANVLRRLGVGRGDRVFVLAGRLPELYVAALGTLKSQGIFCPLFSAFGPEPIRARLALGQARVLLTTEPLYQRKVAAIRAALPDLEHVILVGEGQQPTPVPGTADYHHLMSDASDDFTIAPTDPETPALLHFTSGTTGTPKGAVHVHHAVVAHHTTGRLALDLHPDDIFWCTADPGWVTGTSYGIIAPLTNGVTSIIDEGDFDAERWYAILQAQRVVGAMQALMPDDAIVATYREHGHALVRGTPAGSLMAEMYGKANGCSRGRGGSMHFFDASRRFFGGWAIVGGGLPIAVGLALADKLQNRQRVTACFFGDGAVAEGEFHESLNLAALWKLPVLFLCENNLYAMGTHLARHQAQTDICVKARGDGVKAEAVDGMDIRAVEAAARQAAEAVRRGEGPFLLEARTYRFRAHSMYDAELYRSKQEVEQWKPRDPIVAFQKELRKEGLLADPDLAVIESQVAEEIEEAVAFAEAGPWEPVEDLTKDVYTPEMP